MTTALRLGLFNVSLGFRKVLIFDWAYKLDEKQKTKSMSKTLFKINDLSLFY